MINEGDKIGILSPLFSKNQKTMFYKIKQI